MLRDGVEALLRRGRRSWIGLETARRTPRPAVDARRRALKLEVKQRVAVRGELLECSRDARERGEGLDRRRLSFARRWRGAPP